MIWKHIIWISFILALSIRETGGQVVAQTRLYSDVFENEEKPYNPLLVPKCDSEKSVELYLDVAYRQLISLEEKAQILTSNVWMRVYWDDCRINWNSSDYEGIQHLTVPWGTAWVPDLALYDSAGEEEMMPGMGDFLMRASSDGRVLTGFPTVIKTICIVKVTYFPFDVQYCTIKLGSWTHALKDIDIFAINPAGTSDKGDLSSFVPNNEWEVESFNASRHVLSFPSGSFPDVRFTLKMRRRPQFYLMTMLFPCILVGAIAMIGFLLPAESGEKISLEVTVLLSLAVFLLVISDFLPPSADEFPIIGTYFAAAMVMVSVSLVLSVFVLNVHHRGENGTPLPRWARKVFLRKWCPSKNKYEANQYNHWDSSSSRSSGSYKKYEVTDGANTDGKQLETRPAPGIERFMFEQTDALHKVTNHFSDKDRAEEMCDEWRALARILDRIFLFIYIVLFVIISGALLVPLSASDGE